MSLQSLIDTRYTVFKGCKTEQLSIRQDKISFIFCPQLPNITILTIIPWWHHATVTLSHNSVFYHHRKLPVTRGFDNFTVVSFIKLINKQSCCRFCENCDGRSCGLSIWYYFCPWERNQEDCSIKYLTCIIISYFATLISFMICIWVAQSFCNFAQWFPNR